MLGSVLNVELEVDSPSSPEGLHNVPDYSTDTSMLWIPPNKRELHSLKGEWWFEFSQIGRKRESSSYS